MTADASSCPSMGFPGTGGANPAGRPVMDSNVAFPGIPTSRSFPPTPVLSDFPFRRPVSCVKSSDNELRFDTPGA